MKIMSIESKNNFENKSLRELETEKIIAETKQNKESLKENISQTIINNLTSKEGYTVRSLDELGLINKITSKWNHIDFNNEGDKIWPNDIIKVIDGNVFRTHNGEDKIVGVVKCGFKKIETTTKILKEVEINKVAKTELEGIKKENKKSSKVQEVLKSENNINELKKEITKSIALIKSEKYRNKFTKIIKACKTEECFININNQIQEELSKETKKKNLAKNEKKTLIGIPTLDKTVPYIEETYKGNFKSNESTTTSNEKALDKEQISLIMSKYPTLLILKDVLEIWKNAAEKEKATEIFDIIGLGDKEAIQNGINESTRNFNIVWSKIKKLQPVTNYQINKVLEPIFETEKKETIVSNMRGVQLLLNQVNTKNYSEKRLEILNLMRNGGLQEGSSKKVEEILRSDILKQKEFKNINNILNNPQTLIYIQNNDKDALKKLGINDEIAEEVIEMYGKVERLQSKNKQVYLDHIKKQEPNISANELNNKAKVYMSIATNKATSDLLSKLLIFDTFENNTNLANKNELNKIYSNMVGVGDYVLSDDNIGIAVETGSMLAISLIPMGVGISASMLAAKVGVGIMRLTRVANLAQKGGKLGALGQTISFAGTTALEGTAFYEGYNFTNNVLYKEHYSNVFDGAGNGTEIAKSIAFFGILKGFSKIGEISKIKNFTDKIPAGTIKKSATILTEAGLLTGAGFSTEVFAETMGWNTDVEPELTWEQYIEALIMVGVFRGAGMIKSSPKSNKGHELKDSKLKEDIVFYKNLKTGGKYTKTPDGKFVNSKGVILKGKPKNLEKVEVEIQDNISIKEWKEFGETGKINDSRIEQLFKKQNDNKSLSKKEQDMIANNEGQFAEYFSKKTDKGDKKETIPETEIKQPKNKEIFENISNNKLIKKLSKIKGWEKVKGLGEGAIKISLERMKALALSGITGGTLSVLLVEIFDEEKSDTASQRFFDLLTVFAMGAAGGLVLSGVKSGTMLLYSASKVGINGVWNTVKIPFNFIAKHKIKTISLVSAGIGGTYYILTDNQKKELEKQNTP